MTAFKLSRYFANLTSSYNAELDDLRTDSEGNNILKARLAKKREQVPQLLMMLEFSPEMVAVAFHGGFHFNDQKAMESLVSREANKLPTWAALQTAIGIEPWAQTLVNTVLTDPNGETFLITTAGLEFLNKRNQSHIAHASDTGHGEQDDHDKQDHEQAENDMGDVDDYDANLSSDERVGDEGEATEFDLNKAGADWLADQGFDRKE